jgi:methylated-DNA-[protein]-cysteine S-methyltransferase
MTFAQNVYDLTSQIPRGKISTYAIIAKALANGKSPAYQAVGTALSKNENAPVVPCHRVIKSDYTIGGFFGETCGDNVMKKYKSLKKEGIDFEKLKTSKKYRKKVTFIDFVLLYPKN